MAEPVHNLLLDTYIQRAGRALLSRLERVNLPFKSVLCWAGELPRYVHFLTSGTASFVVPLHEGVEVEVAMMGNEGFPEGIELLGPERTLRTCIMQVGGTALRIPFKDFAGVFRDDSVMRELVLRLVQSQSMMTTQLVACNGQHDAEERLARWLLMFRDRSQESDLPLTQEYLGQMLGARRATVTITAGNLQRAGLIAYRRGHIRILDGERLADTACECYGVFRRLYNNLYKDAQEFQRRKPA